MDEVKFKEFKAKIQKKYPKTELVEKKVMKGNKSAIELWSHGKRGDDSIGKIIVGIYYTKP